MKVKRELFILIAVIAALSLYIFLQKRGKTHYALPALEKIAAPDIAKITIRKGSSEITLERDHERWLILPQKYPADPSLVKDMIDGVGSPTLTALASESKNYGIYDLDDNQRTSVEIAGPRGALRKMDIGKTAPSHRHTFVRIGDDHRVYHASGNLKGTFDKDVLALRDKSVLKIDGEVAKISLSEGKKQITFLMRPEPAPPPGAEGETSSGKQGEGEGKEHSRWMTADGKSAVDAEVEEIIDTAKNLRCDGFVEDKTKEDLKNPLFTLTLKGTAEFTLSLFEKKEDRYVATSSGSDFPFLLSEFTVKRIRKDPDSLIEGGEGKTR